MEKEENQPCPGIKTRGRDRGITKRGYKEKNGPHLGQKGTTDRARSRDSKLNQTEGGGHAFTLPEGLRGKGRPDELSKAKSGHCPVVNSGEGARPQREIKEDRGQIRIRNQG